MAKELIFRGQPFSAAEGHQMGLINRLCTAESLLSDAIACARDHCQLMLASKSRASNPSVTRPIFCHPGKACNCELTHYDTLTSNRKIRGEGVNAFNEKRKPNYTGDKEP